MIFVIINSGDGGRSYVIGIGDNFPTQPFHRASSCPDLPDPCNWENKVAGSPNPQILTGALVSGPNRLASLILKTVLYRTVLFYKANFERSLSHYFMYQNKIY